jgi:hypothetical protein
MSVMDNEGHDPNGLFNQPSLGSVERAYNDGYAAARAEIERLREALSDAVEIAEGGYDQMTLTDRAGFRRLKEMVRGNGQSTQTEELK